MPSVIAMALVFLLLSWFVIMISSSIARIADASSVVLKLRQSWRDIRIYAEKLDKPGSLSLAEQAEYSSLMSAGKASFDRILDGGQMTDLGRMSPAFASARRDLSDQVRRVVDTAADAKVAGAGVRISAVDDAFDTFSGVLDVLTHKQIETFVSLDFFIILLYFVSFAGIAVLAARIGRLRQKEEAANDFSEALLVSTERERSRIARNLHDLVAQDIVFAKSEMDRLCRGESHVEAVKVKEALERSLAATRSICSNLRLSDDAGPDLVESLQGLCLSVGNRLGLEIDIKTMGRLPSAWPLDRVSHCLRIVQESLTNIAKHAGTRNAMIRIVASYPSVYLIVEDRGSGRKGKPEGLGMTGIRERARLARGEVGWSDIEGGGTRVTLKLAWPEDRKAGEAQ